jgi:uncharacterized membrane protein
MPFAILLLVLFGLLLLVTPFLTIALFAREAKLRRQLNELAEENATQHTKLQRALGELQSKLAAMPAPTTPAAEKPSSPEVRQPVSVPGSIPPLQAPAPTVVPQIRETPAATSRVEAKPPVAPPATPPIIPPAVVTPPQKPTAPVAPVEPKPLAPAVPLTSPTAVPPAGAARVSSSPPTSPLRVPPPKPTLEQRMKSVSSIEEVLGANWFAKLGVIMTVIGLALLGKLALQNLGPAGKAFIIYAVSIVFLGGGILLEKRDRYQLLGRVAIGGGWALLFFSTFGIHYIPAMRVLDSGVLD